MKKLHYSLTLFLLLALVSCSDNNIEFDKIIILNDGHEISVPETVELNILQGIDSYVAELIDTDDETFNVQIDIGFLAGNYVEPTDSDAIKETSVNEDFYYITRDSQYLSSDNCCSFFTFPDAGPANFIIGDQEHFNLVLDIMSTYRSN
jgi:hypothetical protein